jgi:nucleotide-binding universal stress UspA family protein
VQPPMPPRARVAVGAEIANGYYADESAKVSNPVVKFLARHGIAPKIVHKVGMPGEQIAKAASAGKYDLVMMGSHGHSALGNLVMGSVATQVLAHCKVPVMLVR